eukprot:521439_1
MSAKQTKITSATQPLCRRFRVPGVPNSATCKAYNRFIIHDASMVAFKKRGPILSTLTRKICEPLVQGKQYVNLNLTTLPTFAHNIGQKYVAGMQQSNNQCHESLGAISKGDAGFTDNKEIT